MCHMILIIKRNYVRSEVFHGGDYEECHLLGCGAV
jgi:hypothetical protein